MIAISTTCIVCGTEHEPTHADVIAGTWRTCPRCRGQPDRTISGSGELDDDSSGLEGHTAARNQAKARKASDP